MPINNEYNLTFIHIPKTGGTTIETILNMQHKELLWDTSGNLSLGRYEIVDGIEFAMQHYTWDMIYSKFPDFYINSIKFTFVRNPYTRILSEYMWLVKPEKFKILDFKKWLNSFLEKIDNDHKLPQHLFVPDDIDFLCKYENFENELKQVLHHIGLTNVKIPIKNKTNLDKDFITSLFDTETKDKIISVYEKDFEVFKYKK